MLLHEVADALESARAKFHGLAAALSGHINGTCQVDLEKIKDILQEGNKEASEVIQELHKNGQYQPPWAR